MSLSLNLRSDQKKRLIKMKYDLKLTVSQRHSNKQSAKGEIK